MATLTEEPTNKLLAFYQSPVGKKIITGITGLALVGFVLVHMLGNLSYFAGMDAYNLYSEKITSGFGLGKPIYYLIELALLAIVVFHAVLGVNIYLGKRKARQTAYAKYESAGGASKQSLSSRSMILTGLILLVFLVLHVLSFRFGTYYETTIDGQQMRDIALLLEQKMQNPFYAFGYPIVMLLLAFHLRHGVWSALQSLGAMKPRYSPLVYTIGGVLGFLIGVGFLVLPLYIYFTA